MKNVDPLLSGMLYPPIDVSHGKTPQYYLLTQSKDNCPGSSGCIPGRYPLACVCMCILAGLEVTLR